MGREPRASAGNSMVTASTTLLLAGVLLTILQFVSLRRQAVEDARALTHVVAMNAAAAVMFGDRHAALETLSTLDALPDFEAATMLDADGRPFAEKLRSEAEHTPVVATSPTREPLNEVGMTGIRVVEAMLVDGRAVGTVIVDTGLRRAYLRLGAFAFLFVLAGLGALGVSYPIVSRMRMQVARAADRIREQASLLDKAQDAIVVMTLERRVSYWNKSAERLYGFPPHEAVGQALDQLLDGNDASVGAAMRQTVEQGDWCGELSHRRKDGTRVTVEGHWTLVRDDRGDAKSILAIETDISARKMAELRVSRLSRLRAVHGGISSAVMRIADRDELLLAACRVAVTDGVFALAWAGVFEQSSGEGRVAVWYGEHAEYLATLRFSNEAANPVADNPPTSAAREGRLVVCNDVPADPIVGDMRAALLASGHRSLAACPLLVDGRTVAVLVLSAPEPQFFDDEEVSLLEWMRADLSYALDHLEKARRLDYLAYYDALTGLANTSLFHDRLVRMLQESGVDLGVCVILLDVERFTAINDTLGRDAGDTLLRAIASRLRDRIPEPCTVARLSADTFGVAGVCAIADSGKQLRDQMQDAFRAPFHLHDSELHVRAHAGVALYPSDGSDSSTLFKNAEAALKEAKATAQPLVYYQQEMNAQMALRMALEADLRRALELDQFVVYYQPRVDLMSGHVVGGEALIRWKRSSGEIVYPSEFIAIAEETGLILPIGEHVLAMVCRQQAAWLARGIRAVPVSVNFSAVQFRRGAVVDVVRAALEQARLEGRYLEVELTETTAMEDPEGAARMLTALNDLGVRASLDDFGTGFSSLAHLKRFPLAAVKIDRTFIADITQNPDDAAIANAVIALAHGMGLRVVAEGVETEAQLRFLRAKRCDEIQGLAFSAPLGPSGFALILQNGRALSTQPSEDVSVGTLLIVDDESGVRSALNRALRRDGYRILMACSGADALALLAMHQVQVIISDQRMPGMSGAEFLDIARQMYPNTVRIILSGYTDLKAVTDGVNRGAIYKFLTKPWDDDQLREQIREAFRIALPLQNRSETADGASSQP